MEQKDFRAAILSRTFHDEDDSMSLFLDVQGLDQTADLGVLQTEPALEIRQIQAHPEDQKHHALELRTSRRSELNKGDVITLRFASQTVS